MKFDFNNDFDVNKARTYLDKLILDKKQVEIVCKRQVRTLQQNKYLHDS